MNYRMRHILCLFAVILALEIRPLTCVVIPGCPSLYSLEELEPENIDLDKIPVCFCDVIADRGKTVTVSCLYGSKLDNLTSSLQAAVAAGYDVAQINTNHMQFGDGVDLPPNYFKDFNVRPEKISFTACLPARNSFILDQQVFAGQDRLGHLIISTCLLERVPPAITTLTNLKNLELTSNQLQYINDEDFMGLGNLEILDIGDNYLETFPEDAFKGLTNLKDLIIGPNKYLVNDTVFAAVNQVTSLQSLDLDGCNLHDWPDHALSSLNLLQNLTLTKNDIVNLTSNALAGLDSLKILDFRVNLIERMEDGIFSNVPHLKELLLTGNYISEIDSSTFKGLAHLKTLDLGWNEFITIPDDAFMALKMLHTLDLRNNQKLVNLQANSFNGLDNLRVLNLTQTNITILKNGVLHPLANLEALDLTDSKLMQIEDGAFMKSETLKELYLNGTWLTGVPASVFEPLWNLQALDLSGNHWICSDELKPLLQWITTSYSVAAESGRHFALLNSEATLCSAPNKLEGEELLTLNPAELQPYSPEDATPDFSNGDLPDFFPITPPPPDYIDHGPLTLQPLDPFGDGPSNPEPEPEPEPEKPSFTDYNVHAEPKPEAEHKSGSASRTSIAIAVGIVVAAGVSILVVIIVVMSMKRRKQRAAVQANGATEMHIKPAETNGSIQVSNGKTRIQVNNSGDFATVNGSSNGVSNGTHNNNNHNNNNNNNNNTKSEV